MGQRLAITFYDESGEIFLTSYYHLSAYTFLMLKEVNRLIKKYTDLVKNHRLKIQSGHEG